MWAAQCGKHEAIVKNVHDLLAKLAWDFSPEQLDHLFECFQVSLFLAFFKSKPQLAEVYLGSQFRQCQTHIYATILNSLRRLFHSVKCHPPWQATKNTHYFGLVEQLVAE